MTAWSSAQDAAVRGAIQVVLKVWACVTLFMFASLLKTLLAKLLASKFNKTSHFQRIQDCLVKEYYLHALLQPRQRTGDSSMTGKAMLDPNLNGNKAGQAGKHGDSKAPQSTGLASGGLQVLENALVGSLDVLSTIKKYNKSNYMLRCVSTIYRGR